jgi:hypothetical protein
MWLAIFRRDDQVQTLAKGVPGGLSERLFGACAPKADETRSVGDHNGMIIQVLLPGIASQGYSTEGIVRLPLATLFLEGEEGNREAT